MPILTACTIPSLVTLKIHQRPMTSPGVRKRLKSIVMMRTKKIAFMPLTMNLNGTFDNMIRAARQTVTSA